jgi:hypothetical protein
MSDITIQHRSFSSFTSWLRCGKSWQLERQLKAPSEPAWWFVGGSAFHAAAEAFLLNTLKAAQVPVEDAPPF